MSEHSQLLPALVIIYNHRYDKNIDIVESIYGKRFSYIYHLMPFYDGKEPNVIPVYENSWYFQGYIAQGLKHFYKTEHSHYLFFADDLILNPIINEQNYSEHFKLHSNSSFLPTLQSLHEVRRWSWMNKAIEYQREKPGVEILKELPSYDEAIAKFRAFGLEVKPLRHEQFLELPNRIPNRYLNYIRQRLLRFWYHIVPISYTLSYPQVISYSDIVVVSAKSIKKFAHYCGIFAATDLFVELALPTALVLSSKEIVTGKDLALQGKSLWTKEDLAELLPFNRQLGKLLSEFPSGYLYLHPVKLSQWNWD